MGLHRDSVDITLATCESLQHKARDAEREVVLITLAAIERSDPIDQQPNDAPLHRAYDRR